MPNARKTAVDALFKVEKDNAYSNLTLNEMLKKSNLSAADKSLATAVFYGVLDRKITLDYFLSKLTKTPFKKTDLFVKCVLRSALYQIMYMDKIPDSAAVNEAVKIVKNSPKKAQSGFVNAVLRSALRKKLVLPEDDISLKYSCPEWIVNEFIRDYGKETAEKILQEFLKSAPVYVRVNDTKISASELSEKLGNAEICQEDNALKLGLNPEIERNEFYQNGCFHIEDLSSQMAVKMLGMKNNERLLDTCAAPGGKTFTLAQIMKNTGEIIACDIYENRTELIKNGAKRLGLSCIKTAVRDATVFDEKMGTFDAVLCDVPCSGLGILRRKPDIKYKPISDFSELEQIQKNILEASVKYLKPNGRLLYSTCTLRKAENEKQIEDFLKKHTEFELSEMRTFLPHIDGTDGFFAALIKRKG